MNRTALYQSEVRSLRNKRKRVRQLKRNLTLGITLCLLAAALSVTLGSLLVQAKSDDTAPVYKYYTSIEVQYGETLWSIATQNMSPGHYAHITDYIQEISRINRLTDEKIVAGQALIIPYFSIKDQDCISASLGTVNINKY